MSDNRADPIYARIVHPGWCNPRFCLADEEGVTHRSEPRHLEFVDSSVAIWLELGQEFAYPHEVGEPEATVEVIPSMTYSA